MKKTVKSVTFNREWQSNHGMIYYFDITFTDGTVGQFSTNKMDQTKFEIGKEYNVSVEQKQNKHGAYNFINIILDKPFTGGKSFGGGSRNDYWTNPEMVMQLSIGTALRHASDYLKLADQTAIVKGDHIFKVANVICDWYFKGTDTITDNSEKSEIIKRRRYAVGHAIALQEVSAEFEEKLTKVLNKAEVIFQFAEEKIKNAGQTTTPPQPATAPVAPAPAVPPMNITPETEEDDLPF